MTEIDTLTVPQKLTRIERLMRDLEAGPGMTPGLGDTGEAHRRYNAAASAMRDASRLILDLLGMAALPKGEALYKAVMDQAMAGLDPEGRHPGTLADQVRFAKRWTADTFPASDSGQIHFGRALLESLIASAEAHLAAAGTPVPQD